MTSKTLKSNDEHFCSGEGELSLHQDSIVRTFCHGSDLIQLSGGAPCSLSYMGPGSILKEYLHVFYCLWDTGCTPSELGAQNLGAGQLSHYVLLCFASLKVQGFVQEFIVKSSFSLSSQFFLQYNIPQILLNWLFFSRQFMC